jgi:hypothetical protein
MQITTKLAHTAAGLGAGLALAGGSFAVADALNTPAVAPAHHVIHGCVDNRTGAVYVRARCPAGYRAIAWNEAGPRGTQGKTGNRGPRGEAGTDALAPWGAVSAWTSSATYTAGPPASVVTYQGSTYVAAAASTSVTPPSSTADWTEVAAAGTNGTNGSAIVWGYLDPSATNNTLATAVVKQNGNIVGFTYDDTGQYSLDVTGCPNTGTNNSTPYGEATITPAGQGGGDPYVAEVLASGATDNGAESIVSINVFDATTDALANDPSGFNVEVNC